MENKTKIELNLYDDQAYYLALFLKRTTHETFRRHSDPNISHEPEEMAEAVRATVRCLNDAGFAPR